MPSGELLVLEREKKGEGEHAYITRVYLADLMCATDVRGRRSLGEADFAPVGKRLLYTADTGRAMFEGMSRGPVLADGSHLLILVSDGAVVHEGRSGGMLMTLRFRR